MALRLILRRSICSSTSSSSSRAKVDVVGVGFSKMTIRRQVSTTTTKHISFFSNLHRQRQLLQSKGEEEMTKMKFEAYDEIDGEVITSYVNKHLAEPFDSSEGIYYERYVLDSARFAVNFHNQKQNGQLQFVRVLKADYFRVSGSMMYITLEVNDAGKSDLYYTVVYYRPWLDYRLVLAWEHVDVEASSSPSDPFTTE